MIEIKVVGKNVDEVVENLKALIEGFGSVPVEPSLSSLDGPVEPTPGEVVNITDEYEGVEGVKLFDGVPYGFDNATRNTWILLKDGRVVEIKAGGRLPLEAVREKNITKKDYGQIDDSLKVRNIVEVINDTPAKEPEEAKKEEVENFPEPEKEPVDNDLMNQAKELYDEIKELDKKSAKQLLEDYEAKRVSKLLEEDLEDFIEDAKEILDELDDE